MWVGSPNSLIVHSIAFLLFFILIALGYDPATVLLILTTIVSLEAIYLSIFIQIAINKNTQSLETVTEEMEDISEDIEEIIEDVEEIQEEMHEEEASVGSEDDKHLRELSALITELKKTLEKIQK